MPVAFLAGGCDSQWQAAYRALAGQGGLWGLARRRNGSPLQQLLAQPQLMRAFVLPVAYLLLQLLMRTALVPVFRNPRTPVSAVLGRGACSGIGDRGISSSSSSSDAASEAAPPVLQGGILWRFVVGVWGVLVSVLLWGFTRVQGHVMRGVCDSLAVLCDQGIGVLAADCAALFGA
jgi:hypothetical protein